MRKSQDILELWETIVCANINKFGDESNYPNNFEDNFEITQ